MNTIKDAIKKVVITFDHCQFTNVRVKKKIGQMGVFVWFFSNKFISFVMFGLNRQTEMMQLHNNDFMQCISVAIWLAEIQHSPQLDGQESR